MSEPIRVLVYDPDDDFDDELPPSAITPAEYLAAPPPWKPGRFDTLVVFDGADRPLDLNPFGRLHATAIQFEEAADRIAAGERAIVRTSIDDIATFVAFEPDGDDVVVSALRSPPPPLDSYYAVATSPFYAPSVDQRDTLYAYVAAHRDELTPRREEGGVGWRFQNVRLPRAATVAALRTHAADALALDKHLRSLT